MKYLSWSDTIRFLHFSILFVAKKKANVRPYPQADRTLSIAPGWGLLGYINKTFVWNGLLYWISLLKFLPQNIAHKVINWIMHNLFNIQETVRYFKWYSYCLVLWSLMCADYSDKILMSNL